MPPLIRRYIKTSFVFLLAGLALGGYVSVSTFVIGAHPPPIFIYWITAATLVRAVAEIGLGLWGAGPLRLLVAAGGLGQLAAGALFVVNMWWRVRMPAAAAPR